MSLLSVEFERHQAEEGPVVFSSAAAIGGLVITSHDTQRALINILDDLTAERANFEDGQRALLNILEDSEIEKLNLEGAQRAVLNILEDFDLERSKVSAINRDLYNEVKERRRAQMEIKELNRVLEQRVSERTSELAGTNKELEAFAYSVSHDLRAPLRHLDGFLTLLSKRCYSQLDERAKHYIDSTLQASQRMGRLIDELLQFSRLGRTELRKGPVKLGELVDAARRELEPEGSDRKIEWHIEKLPTVHADQGMLRQVIENLLANALKFTQHKSVSKIEIASRMEPNGDVVTQIRDNGAGFDMQYYSKLFQVFQRLHSEDEFEGTGIGLANVRRIIDRHGGRVWAEGAVSKGATFYFSLPAPGVENGAENDPIEIHFVS